MLVGKKNNVNDHVIIFYTFDDSDEWTDEADVHL